MQKRMLGEVCVEKGWITREQLQEVLAQQKGLSGRQAIGDILVSKELITEKQKAEALSIVWNLPFVDLATMTPDQEVLQELLNTLKPEVCRRLKALPYERVGNLVRIAMVNPLDVFAQDEIRALMGKEITIEPATVAEEDIVNLLNQVTQGPDSDMAEILDTMMAAAADEADIEVSQDEEETIDVSALREMSDEAPVIALSKAIILRAVQEKASDIHIQPYKERTVVRLRIDGVLREVMTVPKELHAALVSRIKIMSELDIANRLVPQDGRIGLNVLGRPYDFRVSTLPGVLGEKIVMRILDKGSTQVGLEKLGFSTETRERFEQMITSTYGIILITGPTGSGKSTTLYSVLSRLNVPEKNIVTVEDPVEYQLPGLTQVQANPAANLTFATALKAFLRQDPNIIMVGEIRDLEVARIAIEAALTGHLVLSTLHTNDAPTAVTRLAEMGIDPFLISSSVIGVLAQRLVRRICEKCKEAYEPDPVALRRAGFEVNTDERLVFYRGRGCDACGHRGYKGRMGIYELFRMSDTLRELVNKGEPAYTIRALARQEGMKTLQEDAIDKIKLGFTTLEEAIRVISSG
ncbi:MAG: Flp pilus assembly complex ATPase component TadA [Armatimonadetes bacterium]|nr:Flp pilus assembly complex ATPase component TadA [Armatimonadota bacterium]HOM82512.1 ATPase, T2SS/T4P/T4SS family [Armatimonadota bacterium]